MIQWDNNLFIRIPKNASTSCEFTIREAVTPNVATIISGYNDVNIPNEVRANANKRGVKLHHGRPQDFIDCGLFSKKQLDSFTKFSVIRNPIDRIQSAYHYLVRHKRKSLADFTNIIKNNKLNHLVYWPQTQFITSDTILIRYEHLKEDFERYIGIELKANLNVSNRPQEEWVLGTELEPIVRGLYKEDIELWENIS